MTKLEAINSILFMINEEFINSLDDMSQDAQSIDEVITMVTREVCMDDKIFNIIPTELKADKDGKIHIGENILGIDPIDSDGQYRVVQRKLYDVYKKTDVFTDSVFVNAKMLYGFDDLEDIVQNYIVKLVAIKKVTVEIGNAESLRLAQMELEAAHKEYLDYNMQLEDLNMFDENGLSVFNRYYNTIW